MPRSRAATRSVSVSVVLMLAYFLFNSFVQMCHGDPGAKAKGGVKSCNVSVYFISILCLMIVF